MVLAVALACNVKRLLLLKMQVRMYLILAAFNFIFLMEIEEGNTKESTKYQIVNEQLERARTIPKLFLFVQHVRVFPASFVY